MPEPAHLEIPHASLPEYLRGLALPATVNDAVEYAEEHGAPPEVLEFMESLPAAVYTSDVGLRHAFSMMHESTIPATDPEEVEVSKDGTAS
jgi:uncharacterized protein DUF2795